MAPGACPDQLAGRCCQRLGLGEAVSRADLGMEDIRSAVPVALSLKRLLAIQVEMWRRLVAYLGFWRKIWARNIYNLGVSWSID